MRHFIQFTGGLGDVFIRSYACNCYEIIDNLEVDDTVDILSISHNPHILELFHNHPNSHKLRLHDAHHFYPEKRNFETEEEFNYCVRSLYRLPNEQTWDTYKNPEPFSPNPEDLKLYFPQFYAKKPFFLTNQNYIAIQPGAGHLGNRALSNPILNQLIALFRAYFHDYDIHVLFRNESPHRSFLAQASRDNHIHIHTNLDVAGSALVVKNARFFAGSHSAFLQLAWFEDIPTLVLYPTDHPEFQQDIHYFTWGIRKPNCLALPFSEYNTRIITKFIQNRLSND